MFLLSQKIFNVNDVDLLLDDFEFIKTNKKIKYCNIPFSFDIETSSFYYKGEKCAIMYAFVFGINGKCIIGRTYDELLFILDRINKKYMLDENKRIVVYVHNLAYEFQFIRKWIEWIKIFAIEERKPIYAISNLGIEFRCSYILSGYSLEKVGENLLKYKVSKMVGDLDYSLIRHSKTKLTLKELGYILNDGLIVMAYIQEEIEYNGDITKIPLTKTGYVRNYVRNCCLFETKSHKKGYAKFKEYRKLMRCLQITSVDEYKQLKRAFMGGFTHANAIWSNKIIKNVHSYDETSAYPFAMVSEKYPMGRAELVQLKNKEDFIYNLNNYCCLFDITFYNLQSTTSIEHPLPLSKCFKTSNYEIDNGRVVNADVVSTTITEQDFFIYIKFYSYTKIEISNFRRYKKDYLPTNFVKAILKLYSDKTKLKGVSGKEIEYLKSKEQINSCYGMCVTDICRDDICYDGLLWSKQSNDIAETLNRYNKSIRRFISYNWGIWVTAYARRNLFTAIYELKEDYCYSDTDSVKFVNYEKHKKYFETYNKNVLKKLENAMKYHNIDIELCKPKTIKGDEKILGVWDFDGYYKYFKTLGAKRYMYVDDNNEIHLTLSGVNKKNAIPFLKHKYNDNISILNNFKDELYIPSEYMCDGVTKSATGKQTHTYIDDEISGYITDYLGVKCYFKEKSCIHLEGCDYELSLSTEYVEYLLGLLI